jgi:hypothetical protein
MLERPTATLYFMETTAERLIHERPFFWLEYVRWLRLSPVFFDQ